MTGLAARSAAFSETLDLEGKGSTRRYLGAERSRLNCDEATMHTAGLGLEFK